MESGADFINGTIDFNFTINTTTALPPIVLPAYFLMIRQFVWYVTVVVYPGIAVFGLTGNVFSVIVLVKAGLNKPSNVLLVSLCVADSFSLFSALNIPNIVQYFPIKAPSWFFSWEYPELTAHVLFVLTLIFEAISIYGVPLSATFCTFITMERFVAVFYPLHFNAMVTTRRVWTAVGIAVVLWIPYAVANVSMFHFDQMYIPQWDLFTWYIRYEMNPVIWLIHTNIAIPLSRHITLIIVIVGSVLISLRVSMTMKKRQEIISSSAKKIKKSSKTTSTLLAVCAMFSVTKLAGEVEYVVNWFDWVNRNELFIVYGILALLDTINSSCNFIIYITMNKQFRNIFRSMLFRKKW